MSRQNDYREMENYPPPDKLRDIREQMTQEDELLQTTIVKGGTREPSDHDRQDGGGGDTHRREPQTNPNVSGPSWFS